VVAISAAATSSAVFPTPGSPVSSGVAPVSTDSPRNAASVASSRSRPTRRLVPAPTPAIDQPPPGFTGRSSSRRGCEAMSVI
jgi:hypothetical protein